MRLLIVVPLYPPAIGGAELQAQRLARRLDSLGARVTILTRRRAGCALIEREDGVRVVRALDGWPVGPLWGLTMMQSTKRWLRRLSADWDLVHNQQVDLHSWASVRVAMGLGRPSVLRFAATGEGGDLARLSRRRFGNLFLEGLRHATRFVALTAAGASEISRYGLPAARTRIIPNGVDVAAFGPLPWPDVGLDDPARLLFVGRLVRQKGLDILLAALSRIKDGPRFHLRVVGSGPDLASLRAQARDAGLESVVEFRGARSDIRAEYAWSELVVLPSRFEGMSNVALEALASARPVLGARVAGISDLVSNDHNGWLVEPESVDSLAAACLDLMSKRNALRSVGLSGRRCVEQNNSLDQIAAMYMKEYETIMADRPSR